MVLVVGRERRLWHMAVAVLHEDGYKGLGKRARSVEISPNRDQAVKLRLAADDGGARHCCSPQRTLHCIR